MIQELENTSLETRLDLRLDLENLCLTNAPCVVSLPPFYIRESGGSEKSKKGLLRVAQLVAGNLDPGPKISETWAW